MTENEIEYVANGRFVSVALTRKVCRAFRKLDPRVRFPLERWMKHYANEGPADLPPEYLKKEQRISSRGVSVLIFAFRERTTRLYGGMVPERQLFLVTEIRREEDPEGGRREP